MGRELTHQTLEIGAAESARGERTRQAPSGHVVWLGASIGALLIGGLVALSGYDLLFGPLSLVLFGAWVMTFVAAIRWNCGPAVITLAVVLPIVLVAAMIVDGPSTVRAIASQDQLADAYAEVQAGREVDDVGFYRVTKSSIGDSGCAVFVTHTLLMVDDSGVAYCPDGITPESSTFESLFGPLYSYSYVR